MAETNDKRKSRRIQVFLPVDCRSPHYLQSKNSLNISTGGIFIETDLLETPGTSVELEFMFKVDDESFEKVVMRGEVIWVGESKKFTSHGAKSKGMGIKFINPPSDFIKKIEKLCINE